VYNTCKQVPINSGFVQLASTALSITNGLVMDMQEVLKSEVLLHQKNNSQ